MSPAPAPWPCSQVAVIGAGAMGVSLAAALGRHLPVILVCRNPERADVLTRTGVAVSGQIHLAARPRVVRSVAELPARSLSAIFIATKTTAIHAVAAQLRPRLTSIGDGPESPFVISFQNGIEPGRQLIDQLGNPRVLRMVLNYGARIYKHATAEITLWRPPNLIGRLDPAHDDACRAIAALLTAGALETRAVDDIEPYVWMKGIANAAVNPVAALTDAAIGEVLDSPARRLVAALLDEAIAVARAAGINLPGAPEQFLWQTLEASRDHTPSMVEDIRSGRPSEVGQLNRQIIARGRRLGVPTPSHALVTDLIDAFDWRVFQRSGRAPHLRAPAPRINFASPRIPESPTP